MSDFADRIRAARTDGPTPLVHLDAARAVPVPGPTLAELEAQRRRVAELTRKVDELNAAILNEILRHPDGATGYPRTVAALARKTPLSGRAQD